MTPPREAERDGWIRAWPDLVAFFVGLAIAWFARWNATDLVWSLWLSSLVVGYAMIVWNLSSPLRELAGGLARERGSIPLVPVLGTGALLAGGGLFLLAFFTVHFGGFHFVHGVFLSIFFPLGEGPGTQGPEAFPGLVFEVIARYWWFLPVAFVAERAAFERAPSKPPDTAVTIEAIATRKAKKDAAEPMFAPYKNVVRMHLMIFFFAFAHFAKLENFAVYAVVYAVYFFPWRLVRRRQAQRLSP